MANVHITSDYTITNVNQCNTAADAHVWYQVEFHYNGWGDSTFFVTPYNDPKFPKGLAKDDFISNVLPEINTYVGIISGVQTAALDSWDTEA